VRELLLLAALLAGVVVLTPLAARVKVPQPVLLTVFGLALAALPFWPELRLDPHLILPLVLPPLLFAATQRTTAREFRQRREAVLLLAVGLTVATTAVVALAAHQLGLSWPTAWVLGAIVSPPDPVAATSVARQLHLPHRLVTVLEGEGMFNDATALVLYKVAVLAAVTGHFSSLAVGRDLVLALVVGVGLGFLAGWLSRLALSVLHDPPTETTVTAVAPFAAYLAAEQLHGSGVLAVLVLGLYLRSYGHPAITSEGWLLGRAVWRYADFVITSLVFTLLGFELTTVLEHADTGLRTLWLAAVVVVTVVLFRAAWTFPAARVAHRRQRRRQDDTPYGWRETTVVAWAGMRGVVTVATALALPVTTNAGAGFPHREEIILVALACVLVTLVAQGLSLPALVRALGVGLAGSDDGQVNALRRRAAAAALHALEEQGDDDVPQQLRSAAIEQYRGIISAQEALQNARSDSDELELRGVLQRLLGRGLETERDLVIHERNTGQVPSGAADEVLRDIEQRAVRDFG
jgi:monovalent cation/hydrogen antiporter